MGMDLTNEHGEYFGFGHRSWAKALALAKVYGWRPAGTEPGPLYYNPDYLDRGGNTLGWDGGYFTNSLQTVTAEDARAIAEALEKVLPNIPVDPNGFPKWRTMTVDESPALSVLGITNVVEAYEGEKDKQYLQDVIAFFRRGAFRIA